jgi:hypothetical protein
MKVLVTFKPNHMPVDTLEIDKVVGSVRPTPGNPFWGFEAYNTESLWINQDIIMMIVSKPED